VDYKVASMADESPRGGGSHLERREVFFLLERREVLIGDFKRNLPKRYQDMVVGRGLIFLP